LLDDLHRPQRYSGKLLLFNNYVILYAGGIITHPLDRRFTIKWWKEQNVWQTIYIEVNAVTVGLTILRDFYSSFNYTFCRYTL
jgi:hypothetical protein